MLQVLGERNPACIKPLLESLAQLRASDNFDFEAELDVVVGRAVFWELDNLLPATWLLLDYACDFLYVVDTFIRMHEGVYSVDIVCEAYL